MASKNAFKSKHHANKEMIKIPASIYCPILKRNTVKKVWVENTDRFAMSTDWNTHIAGK